jgi:hypothetical protein
MKQKVLVTIRRDDEIMEEIEFDADIHRNHDGDVTTILFPYAITVIGDETLSIKQL